jgi:hypothetical protein
MQTPYLGAQYRPRMFTPEQMQSPAMMLANMPQQQQASMMAPPDLSGMMRQAPQGTIYGGGGGAGGGGGQSGAAAADETEQDFGGSFNGETYIPPQFMDSFPQLAARLGMRVGPPDQQTQLRASDMIARAIGEWQPGEEAPTAKTSNTVTAPQSDTGRGVRAPANPMMAPAPSASLAPHKAGDGGMLDRVSGMLGSAFSMANKYTPGGMLSSLVGKPLAGMAPIQTTPTMTSDATNSGWSSFEDPNTFKSSNTKTAPQSEDGMVWMPTDGGGTYVPSDQYFGENDPVYDEWLQQQLDDGWYQDDSGTLYRD